MIYIDINFKDEGDLIADFNKNEIFISFLEKGEAGKTPIKGIDYFTNEEKEEMINRVQFEATGMEAMTIDELNRLF